jgi:hypothetical protein
LISGYRESENSKRLFEPKDFFSPTVYVFRLVHSTEIPQPGITYLVASGSAGERRV